MKLKLLLRIAAILICLHTIGHTYGVLSFSKNPPNAAVGQVIKDMETNHFEIMGRDTNLASFYQGYGYSMTLVLLFFTALLWKLSIDPNRSLIRLVAVFLIILGLIEYIFFFPLPAALSLLAGISTIAALFNYQKN
jgi:hypothetical protein